jgi:hypothetical protein
MVPHFWDETYGDVKTPGHNIQGRIVRGLNVRGHNIGGRIVPVPPTSYRIFARGFPQLHTKGQPLCNTSDESKIQS